MTFFLNFGVERSKVCVYMYVLNFFPLLILEIKEGREKERQKYGYERETLIVCFLHVP